jgi:magnesium-transporting ATPase (P-type)
MVVYVGNESKIMMNAKKPPKKISNIMNQMNYMLYTVFAFQFLLIVVYASISLLWNKNYKGISPYLNLTGGIGGSNQGLSWLISLLTFWVAYSHLIPISLYVIIEMLKLSQAYIVGKDVKMYDEETENFALCRNSDLIEELGQIDFVFSDKTGTLTQNKMLFRKCSIGNAVYGEASDADNMDPKSIDAIKGLIFGQQTQ